VIRAVLGVTLAASAVVSGHVAGSSGKHSVYVALWAPTGFLEKPAQALRFDAGVEPAFAFTVADGGRWAMSAYEDVNENGVLDQGFFGPKEPSGFSVPFKKWRKPTFDDVVFDVLGDVDAGIAIH
jgi:uncharacterized protein (DUF2141 family)